MENYISTNMFKRRIEVFCGAGESTFRGIVDKVIDGVLVLEESDIRTYVSIEKIVSFKELD